MYQRLFSIFIIFLIVLGCSKKDELSVKPPDENEAYEIYKEGLDAMNNGDFFSLEATPTTILSKSFAARSTKSTWPLVMGSKVPGYTTI